MPIIVLLLALSLSNLPSFFVGIGPPFIYFTVVFLRGGDLRWLSLLNRREEALLLRKPHAIANYTATTSSGASGRFASEAGKEWAGGGG